MNPASRSSLLDSASGSHTHTRDGGNLAHASTRVGHFSFHQLPQNVGADRSQISEAADWLPGRAQRAGAAILRPCLPAKSRPPHFLKINHVAHSVLLLCVSENTNTQAAWGGKVIRV